MIVIKNREAAVICKNGDPPDDASSHREYMNIKMIAIRATVGVALLSVML